MRALRIALLLVVTLGALRTWWSSFETGHLQSPLSDVGAVVSSVESFVEDMFHKTR